MSKDAPTVETIAKGILVDKVAPWALLTIGGPVLIGTVGAVQSIQPLERGDFYLLDLGIILAGMMEALSAHNVPLRMMQSSMLPAIILLIPIIVFWSTARTGGVDAVGSQWLWAIVLTVISSVVALAGVVAGAVGTANTEVARWTTINS